MHSRSEIYYSLSTNEFSKFAHSFQNTAYNDGNRSALPDPSTSLPYIRGLALLLFYFAALTDWLDGWLARKFGQVSEFGKFMDALADKVLTMGMFVSLVGTGSFGKMVLIPNLAYTFPENS